MSGSWVFVCGPSGAGKDSVMASAQQFTLDRHDILFARRMVTRPVQTGSDHDPVSEADFNALLQAGGIYWHWFAHGFCYGIATHHVDAVMAGQTVVVNGSRAHVKTLVPSPDLRIVEISAPPDRLQARLLSRGRDSDSAVASRLERTAELGAQVRPDLVIVNAGELRTAGHQLAHYLITLTRSKTG